MTDWGNICRICSSPADYNIFAKIPTYLHGSTNEFLNFQKPINVLLEETSGLKVIRQRQREKKQLELYLTFTLQSL